MCFILQDIIGPRFRLSVPEIKEPLPPPKTCPIQFSDTDKTTVPCILFTGVLSVVIHALIWLKRYKENKEDVYFLFRCPSYPMIRSDFYNEVNTLIPDITQLPVKVLVNEVMNSFDYFSQ